MRVSGTRDSGFDLLRGYATGRFDRDALELAMADWVFSSAEEDDLLADEDAGDQLTLALARSVCGIDRTDDELDAFVQRALASGDALPTVAQVLAMLPLIEFGPEFCEVVAKYANGVISRTGYLSHVAKRYGERGLRVWLEQRSPEELMRVCALLGTDDFRGAWESLVGPGA